MAHISRSPSFSSRTDHSDESDRRPTYLERFSNSVTYLFSSMNTRHADETQPLLSTHTNGQAKAAPDWARKSVLGVLLVVFAVGIGLMMSWRTVFPDSWAPFFGGLPRDPMLAALTILDNSPVIDGHIDLPILIRETYRNNVTAVDLQKPMPRHVDIPRLRQGKVGAFFWSVYVSCPPKGSGPFSKPTWRVRDTLEQIDTAHQLIQKYPETFHLATSSDEIKSGIRAGKISSLLGVEGGHQLGNSLSVLRQYHALGVRYVTLTHTCHNAFADSCGYLPGIIPLHHGLSDFGRTLVTEMNRLGVLVDLSHTSDDTAIQALKHSRAPVIWSHSSARALKDVPRNVPDSVLKLIGTEEGQDAVVMVNFSPFFVAVDATLTDVANHIDHIGKVAGRHHVGIGSDFDGISDVPDGLEDVSKYPALIAELYRRGWNKFELAGLTGGNLLRILEGAEKVANEMQAEGVLPAYDIYEARRDI